MVLVGDEGALVFDRHLLSTQLCLQAIYDIVNHLDGLLQVRVHAVCGVHQETELEDVLLQAQALRPLTEAIQDYIRLEVPSHLLRGVICGK